MNKQLNQLRRVAIVGAGLSGTAFLSGLVGCLHRDSRSDVEIHVFEGGGEFGPGIYRTDLPATCMLNHENRSMGWVAPDDQSAGSDHFSKYLVVNAERLAGEHECLNVSVLKSPVGYVPRFVYGTYLKEAFERVESIAKLVGIRVIKHSAYVEKIRVLNEKATVTFVKDGELQNVSDIEHVILAVGHWGVPLLNNVADAKQFFRVYPIEPLTNRDMIAGKHIGVVGTGLSGVDAALTALEAGVQRVTLTSRNARLRAVRGPTVKYHRRFFTRDSVDDIVREQGYIMLEQVIELFSREYTVALSTYKLYQQAPELFNHDDWSCYIGQKFYVPDDNPDIHGFAFPEEPIARLKYHVREVENCPKDKGLLWRSIVVSMYDMEDRLEFGDYVYQRLRSEDKVAFMKQIYGSYLTYTAAMPLPSAKRLLSFYEQGKLAVLKGFESTTYDSDSGLLKIALKNGKLTYVDIVVDATGQIKDLSLHPLYSQMIREGIAVAHPAGGMQIDPNTHALLAKDGTPSPVFKVVGPATIGSAYVLKPDSNGNAESSLYIANQVYAALRIDDSAVSLANT